jgi:hypothetical protein
MTPSLAQGTATVINSWTASERLTDRAILTGRWGDLSARSLCSRPLTYDLPMSELDDLDRPYEVRDEDAEEAAVRIIPANFEAMTPEQRLGWPGREVRRWVRSHTLWLLAPLVLGILVWLPSQSPMVLVGAIGLGYDVVGIWMLAENLLTSDEETSYKGTYHSFEFGYLLARRERGQARVALTVATVGFALQLVSLVLSTLRNK